MKGCTRERLLVELMIKGIRARSIEDLWYIDLCHKNHTETWRKKSLHKASHTRKMRRMWFLDTDSKISIQTARLVYQQKFRKLACYKYINFVLKGPEEEAAAIVQRRFPVPRLVVCAQHGSQARFLTAKLNPSNTHSQTTSNSSEVIFTDDVSLGVFTEHLKKLAVQT